MHQRASNRHPRRLLAPALLLVAAVLALAAAGCGGDDDEEPAPNTEATSEEGAGGDTGGGGGDTGGGGAGGDTLAVSMTDFALDPADPTVEAGTVTIEATNDGQAPHTIEVEGPGGEAVLEPTLDPGQSGELEVDLSEPGSYTWYCPVGNHQSLGMEGEITVEG